MVVPNSVTEFDTLQKEIYKNNVVNDLSNNRGTLKEHKRDIIFSGYNKIMSFISRGVNTQQSKISQ